MKTSPGKIWQTNRAPSFAWGAQLVCQLRHENARPLSAWDPLRRDENVAYYLSKLDALEKKFGFCRSAPAEPASDRALKQTELNL